MVGAFVTEGNQILGTVNNMWSNLVGAFARGWAQIQAFLSGHPLTATGTIKYLSTAPNGPAPGMMASGGIVRARPGGTPKIIGEAGTDEAVIPLTPDILSQIGGGSGGSGFRDLIINEVTDSIGTANAVLRRLNARGAV
jgi:hypothetical protein